MGADEIKFVQEAFDLNWISPVGPNINAFEAELADYTKSGHCAALASGTSAIHLALIILGVGPGDEVVCSSFTFSASCNPIRYQGAIPVFIDSERDTWNMDPTLLEAAIKDRIAKGKKPKAIVVVHLYGVSAKMNEIMEVSSRYGIPVIEDAAEALGSTYLGASVGTLGDFGVYSFNGNKIITTSGGGALVSANKAAIDKARFLATQARDPAPHYEHSAIGYNYRLSNVCAGIGRGQLRVLDERVKRRREIFGLYKSALAKIPGIEFPGEFEGFYSNRWLTTILVDPVQAGFDREKIRLALERENIESRPLWKPMHVQPVFREFPSYTNGVSEKLFEQGLCLPSGSNLTDDQIRKVLGVILQLRG
jgi:dTDP-4-amino-4,6-dideoxygalactose transaminase